MDEWFPRAWERRHLPCWQCHRACANPVITQLHLEGGNHCKPPSLVPAKIYNDPFLLPFRRKIFCWFRMVVGSLLDIMATSQSNAAYFCLPMKQESWRPLIGSFPNDCLQHLYRSGLLNAPLPLLGQGWFMVTYHPSTPSVPFLMARGCWFPLTHPMAAPGWDGNVSFQTVPPHRYALRIRVWRGVWPFIFPLSRHPWSCGWPLLFKIKKPGGSFVLCRLKNRASVLYYTGWESSRAESARQHHTIIS